MRYCTECGTELPENVSFCVRCGHGVADQTDEQSEASESVTPVADDSPTSEEVVSTTESEVADDPVTPVHHTAEDEVASTAAVEQTTTEPAQTTPAAAQEAAPAKPHSNRKRNILLSLVAVLLIALFGAHKWAESHFDPINDLYAMDEAIKSKDMDAFMGYIEFDDGALLDETSFFQLMEESQWRGHVREQYFDIIEEINESNRLLHNEIFDSQQGLLFTVEQSDILFGLYKGVSLVAEPFELELASNLSKVEMTIQDETFELKKKSDTELLTLYPGEYEVEAKSEQTYGDFEFEDVLVVESSVQDTIDIEFDAVFFDIYSSYGHDDAIVYVNGKSTEQKISEIDQLGPFLADSDVTLYALRKDGDGHEVMSNVLHLNASGSGSSLSFEFDDRNKMSAKSIDDEEVGQYVLEFRDAYENAVNDVAFYHIENYLHPDGPAYDGLKSFVKAMENDNYLYNFTENTVLSVKDKGKDTFEVKTNEKFEFRDKDFSWYDYDREKIYEVVKTDGQFKIVKIDYTETDKERR